MFDVPAKKRATSCWLWLNEMQLFGTYGAAVVVAVAVYCGQLLAGSLVQSVDGAPRLMAVI